MDRFNRERRLKRDKLYRELQRSLQVYRGYMQYFYTFPPSEENAERKIYAWCKLCRDNMDYYEQHNGELNLKCHVRYHISLIESEMAEEREKALLRKNLIRDAETPMGFVDYFDHNPVGDPNECMDREGICKLCGHCVDYTLYESMSNLRDHFVLHVNEEKAKNNAGSGSGSSSGN